MGGALELGVGDDGLVAVQGRQRLVGALVIAADVHFLAGQLVVDHVDLDGGVAGVRRARIAASHVLQPGQGGVGVALVAAHVGDLFEVADRLHVEGVGRRGIAREQGDEPVRSRDGVRVIIVLIEGVDLHQDRAARPVRIGMLAFHLLEIVDGVGPAALFQALVAGVVQGLDRPFLIGELGSCVAGAARDCHCGGGRSHQHQAGTDLGNGQG